MTGRPITRRDFLASGLVTLGALVAGPALWRRALAAPVVSDGPYGPLQPPDPNGLRLPKGFTSRVVARSRSNVVGYTWHDLPDGGACFEADDDGWIYVSNSEVSGGKGGVGALRFDRHGEVVGAYAIATGTSLNCSGGPTPWGTWLSCEEFEEGHVWECDPTGKKEAVELPALGTFRHEAAAVDPVHHAVYLTEDQPSGRFYRFRPDRYPDLSEGTLEAAVVERDGTTSWTEDVAKGRRFDGGEGTWYDDGVVYFTTKGDDRVWAYDTDEARLSLLYDGQSLRGAPLHGVDNITGSSSGDLFVAEDGGNLEIVIITPEDEIAPLLRLTGGAHSRSEITGPAFDPSETRLYFSSQRGFDHGVTYEVSGPFRTKKRAKPTAPSTRTAPPLPDESSGGNSWVAPAAAAAAAAGAAAGISGAARRRRRRGAGPPDA